jgi:hypothetical protein
MSGKIYEYAILFHHKARKVGEDHVTDPSQLLVDVTRIVAKDEKSAQIIAARAIPAEYIDKLDQVEIALRPF